MIIIRKGRQAGRHVENTVNQVVGLGACPGWGRGRWAPSIVNLGVCGRVFYMTFQGCCVHKVSVCGISGLG